MARIGDILQKKGSTVHSVDAEATVFDAIGKMVGANVGSLLVTDGERIAGIFTERDYLRRVALEGRTSKETRVREIMTSKVVCIHPSTEIEEAMAIMSERRIRHLPVIDGGSLVGVVSIGDLVKFRSREQQFTIEYLTDYITGKYPG